MLKELDLNSYVFAGNPQRVTLHWTGGSYTPSSLDAEHYHFLIDGDNKVWLGKYSVADQDSTSSNYAAHVKGFNTKNIGVAICSMAGAEENGTFGKYPITQGQWDVAIKLCAGLCDGYGIEPRPETVASHCEIQGIHGIQQGGKWDVSAVQFSMLKWTELNDFFRESVVETMRSMERPQVKATNAKSAAYIMTHEVLIDGVQYFPASREEADAARW